MKITLTGAGGLIGARLARALQERGDELTVLARDPERTRVSLDGRGVQPVRVLSWDSLAQPPDVEALAGQDAVVHLAGAPVDQRWTQAGKRAIMDSRSIGTRNLVSGLERAQPRPAVLLCASAVGYYGPHGEEPIDEDAPAGDDFLARVCVAWEGAAQAAASHGVRVAMLRTGVVLDRNGGALARMVTPFRLGAGGPVAGGRQYMAWIHADDLVALYVAALDDERWSGPVNATAPEPVTNREFSHALGRALHRPAVLPLPGVALSLLFGEMAQVVTTGVRALPAKALVLGHRFEHPQLGEALQSALSG